VNRGCVVVPRTCNISNTNFSRVGGKPKDNNTNGSCIILNCDNVTDQCIATPAVCFGNLGAIIGALTAGIIVAIILAALCAFALAGGAAYAVNGQIHQGHESEVMNNPLYQGTGNKGENPLFDKC
jgi:hypothetical protein